MSWFDTSGIASLAKTALKEAQKTIDKALDIKDEELRQQPAAATLQLQPTTDFFETWGVDEEKEKQDSGDKESSSSSQRQQQQQQQQSTSIWGSFTGSFFENLKDSDTMTAVAAAKRPESFRDSSESFDKLQSPLVSSKSLPESLSDRSGSGKSATDSAIVPSTSDLDFASVASTTESLEEFVSEG